MGRRISFGKYRCFVEYCKKISFNNIRKRRRLRKTTAHIMHTVNTRVIEMKMKDAIQYTQNYLRSKREAANVAIQFTLRLILRNRYFVSYAHLSGKKCVYEAFEGSKYSIQSGKAPAKLDRFKDNWHLSPGTAAQRFRQSSWRGPLQPRSSQFLCHRSILP